MILQKFLFIGLGGSGGKTLRFLKLTSSNGWKATGKAQGCRRVQISPY